MSAVAPPRRKSRPEAAAWVGRRLQDRVDGATREQILFELGQDGFDEREAASIYEEVLSSYRTLALPQGWGLVLLVAGLAPAVIAGGWIWRWAKPGPPTDIGYTADIVTTIPVAMAIGVLVAIAAGIAAGGRRSWKLSCIACAADVVAFIGPSKIAGVTHGPGYAVSECGLVIGMLMTLWVLSRVSPRYELEVEKDGTLRWERLVF